MFVLTVILAVAREFFVIKPRMESIDGRIKALEGRVKENENGIRQALAWEKAHTDIYTRLNSLANKSDLQLIKQKVDFVDKELERGNAVFKEHADALNKLGLEMEGMRAEFKNVTILLQQLLDSHSKP